MREYFKACNVYCRPESNQAIVAAVFNHGGMTAEKPGDTSVVAFSDSEALKRTIKAALDRCEYEENCNYLGSKRTDWPAFQASGYKTVKRFEADFIRLDIRGVNEKNFFYEATSPDFGDFGLHLKLIVNANTAEYGEAVQYLVSKYLACTARSEQGAPPARGGM
ncbi:MAG: hypothetical protein HY040_06345 [Planctomycetes bacterium]|nr:hypothetical protein [Planctomycetota bacterium]